MSVRLQTWQAQIPALYEAYMQYKYHPGPTEVPDNSPFHIAVLGIEGTLPIEFPASDLLILPKGYDGARALPQNHDHSYLNQTLLHHGLLGTGPVQPELAISVPTLELYRQCRLRCPQFSIQQWVKVLCDLANVSSSTYAPSTPFLAPLLD